MPIARSNFVAGVIGGKIYVAGGSIRWPKTTDRTDVYDPATESWSTVASMPAPRGSIVGGVWNGSLVVASGKSDAFTFDNRAFVYTVATGQWQQPARISARCFGTEGAFLYAEGDCMYYAGRQEGLSGENWIIRFAPMTGQVWFLGPASPVLRMAAIAACPAGSREIYLTGGLGGLGSVTNPAPAPMPATEKAVIHRVRSVPQSTRAPVMDHACPPAAGAGMPVNAGDGRSEIQQGVTAGRIGQLMRVELFAASGRGTGRLYINKGSPWQTDGNILAADIRVTRPGWFSVDVSGGKLCFNKGDRFVIGILGTGNDPWHLGTSPAGDAADKMWRQTGVNPPAMQQEGLAFRTYVDEVVPAPAIQ
jgi:hypothetical protein